MSIHSRISRLEKEMKSLSWQAEKVATDVCRVQASGDGYSLARENTDGFQGDTEEQIQRHIDVMYMGG